MFLEFHKFYKAMRSSWSLNQFNHRVRLDGRRGDPGRWRAKSQRNKKYADGRQKAKR